MGVMTWVLLLIKSLGIFSSSSVKGRLVCLSKAVNTYRERITCLSGDVELFVNVLYDGSKLFIGDAELFIFMRV